MSFNPNIPAVTDPTLQSAAQIKANFQAINAAFAANHVSLTQDASVAGMHTFVLLKPQTGGTPDPVTDATQLGLYTKLVSSIPNLFFAPNSAQTPIQLTYPSIKADSTTTQYSFVMGPFIIYAGTVNKANGQTVTLSPGSGLLFVDLTWISKKPGLLLDEYANATGVSNASMTFTVKTNITTASDIYYLAVGIP